MGFAYGAITLCGRPFQGRWATHPFCDLPDALQHVDEGALQPRTCNGCSLSRTPGLGSSPVARRYWGNLMLMSFPPGTEMFQFPGFASRRLCIQRPMTGVATRRVAPFGDPRIEACLAAPRGLSQPSTSFIASRRQGIHRTPLVA